MKSKFRYCKRLLCFLVFLGLLSCGKMQENHTHDRSVKMEDTTKVLYTCPMPEDSVFSDKPGNCPKCGMELIKVIKSKTGQTYSCPMHPEIVSDSPGTCPKCGMDLEPIASKKVMDTLESLIQPTNYFVASQLKAIVPSSSKGAKRIGVEGYLTYNPDNASSISARVSGRVEKLYVRSNFQRIKKGDKLLEIYSPELQTAQNEWLYVVRSKDATDSVAQKALRSRLANLGMDEANIIKLQKTGKVHSYVPVYAQASGHVHFLNGNTDISSHAFGLPTSSKGMPNNPMEGEEQQVLREGDYVKKGELLFTIADPSNIWALFKVMPSDIASIRKGEAVEVLVNGSVHEGKVDYIEKSFEDFYTVRVYLRCEDHSQLKVGSLIKGYISVKGKEAKGIWVPASSVLSLGKGKSAVFVKKEIGYAAKEVRTGTSASNWVEITMGLSAQDSIAPIASYLVDSEAFVMTK